MNILCEGKLFNFSIARYLYIPVVPLGAKQTNILNNKTMHCKGLDINNSDANAIKIYDKL